MNRGDSNWRYILIGQTPVPCPDLKAWASFMDNLKHVRLTRVGPYIVSTIFLGLDHSFFRSGPPLLFETMVITEGLTHTFEFAGREEELPDFLDIQKRCSTWLEAEAQHQRVIDEIKSPGDSVEELSGELVDLADLEKNNDGRK